MARSTRFIELKRRLRALRDNMLPAKFSPTGDYSARQLDRTRGYRLLAHAEIEAFIEDVCFEAARTSISNWSKTKNVTDALFCLMAHYHNGFAIPSLDEEPPI